MKSTDWAIDCAADFLRRRGYLIVETGAVCKVQGRAVKIPLVAWEEASDTMAFVSVRHPSSEGWRNPTRKQRSDMGHAIRIWKRRNRWKGASRFDVVDVYGEPCKGRPVIDHVENVSLG